MCPTFSSSFHQVDNIISSAKFHHFIISSGAHSFFISKISSFHHFISVPKLENFIISSEFHHFINARFSN